MNYTITNFEGPLDLLLHLIKENNIDIFDINVSEITDQYLNYISKMESLNLNVDSEYLIMAADLIEMKSKSLLPKTEEEIEEDPREELINRLVEYQKYKELSLTFKGLEAERKTIYSKEPTFLEEFKDDSLKIGEDLSIDDLIKAFAKFKEKKFLEKPLNTVITKKEYSVNRRSEEIMNKLSKNKKVLFEDLFEVYTKDYVVVTFLSILELARKGKLLIKQDNNLDKIILQEVSKWI